MPRVKITKASGRVTPGPIISPDVDNTGEAIREVGSMLTGLGQQQIAKEEKAKADSYIFSKSIELSDTVDILRTDLTKRFGDEISSGSRNDYTGYAQEYMSNISDVFKDVVDNAPNAQAKNSLMNNVIQRASSLGKQMRSFETEQNTTLFTNKVNDSVNSLVNKIQSDPSKFQEVSEQFESIISAAPSFLDGTQVDTLREGGKELLTSGFVNGLIRTNPSQALSVLNSGSLDGIVAPNKKAGYLKDAEVAIRRQQAELEKQANIEYDNRLENIKTSIIDDKIGLGEINSLRDAGFFRNEDDFLKLESFYIRRNEENVNLNNSLSRVANALSGSEFLSPSDSKDRRDVDSYFNEVLLPSTADFEPNDQIRAISEFVSDTKIIPNALKRSFSKVSAGDPKEQVEAARLITRTTNSVPTERATISKEFDRASQLLELVDAGISPEEAVDTVNKALVVKGTPEEALRIERYKDNSIGFDSNEVFERVGGFFEFDDPDLVPDELQSDFQTFIKHSMVNLGMGEKAAEEYAYNKLESIWGVSNINRRVFMKHSPEKYYSKGNDNDWMEDQFVSSISELYGDVDTDNYILHPEPVFEKDGLPSYQILKLNSNDPLDGYVIATMTDSKGRLVPVTWRPDPSVVGISEAKDVRAAHEDINNKLKQIELDTSK